MTTCVGGMRTAFGWNVCQGSSISGSFFFFFSAAYTMCGYKCLMNETFSVAKVCRECLKMSLLFILLSIFKLCLKEGRKLKSACCSIVFYREKFRMDRKGLFSPTVVLQYSVFLLLYLWCCVVLTFLHKICHIWIINVFPHHVDIFYLFTIYTLQSHLLQVKFSSYSWVLQALILNWYYYGRIHYQMASCMDAHMNAISLCFSFWFTHQLYDELA